MVTLRDADVARTPIVVPGQDLFLFSPIPVFSQDCNYLAFVKSGRQEEVVVWKVSSGSECERHTLAGHASNVSALAFSSPDRGLLAIASVDGTVKLWDIRNREPQEWRILKGDQSPVLAVAFSPDNSRVATASADGTVSLWEVDTGNQLGILEGLRETLGAMTFSPNGQLLATAAKDKEDSIKVWDVNTRKQRKSLVFEPGFKSVSLSRVAFSGDGKVLAAASQMSPSAPQDGLASFVQGSTSFVKVWNLDTSDSLYDKEYKDQISGIIMNDVGSQFVTVAANGILARHTLRLEDEIREATKLGLNDLNDDECKRYVKNDPDCHDFANDTEFNPGLAIANSASLGNQAHR